MESQSGDELRSLYRWLVAEEELRGRVRLVDGPQQPGTLGSVPALLMVTLAPGGVATVLIGSVIAWIRHRETREGEVTYKLTRSDGTSVEVSVQRVRSTDLAGVQTLITELSGALEAPGHAEGAGSGSPSSSPRGDS